MAIPASTPPQWSLYNYGAVVASGGPANAAGIIDVTVAEVPQDELWLIDRIVVSCTSSKTTTAYLYLNSPNDQNVVEGSANGNFDIADENSPVQVHGGTTLVNRWSGADPGAAATIRIQYTIMKQAS